MKKPYPTVSAQQSAGSGGAATRNSKLETRTCLPALLLLCLFAATANAQVKPPAPLPSPSPSPPQVEKCEQIITHAVDVFGGSKYLNVRTIIGRGLITNYRDGVSQLPARFIDYLVYPDHERTEFFGGGTHIIQTNFGDQGWIFDGAPKTLNDQKQESIDDFKFNIKTSIDTLLRGTWRKEGAKLSYIGRREAGLGKRNETIRLTWPDDFWIEYEFGAKDFLPAKVIYLRKRKNVDSGEVEEMMEEDRLLKPIAIDGVTGPWIIDHFIAGKQSSRIAYESIEYNKPVPDSLFTKPATIKGMK